MANLDQSWVGVDVTEVFSEACGRPVTVVNDADAAGLAEQQFGAAQAARTAWSSPPRWAPASAPRADLHRRAHSETLSSAIWNRSKTRVTPRSTRHPPFVKSSIWAAEVGQASDQVLFPDGVLLGSAAYSSSAVACPGKTLIEVPAVHRHQDPDRRSQAAQ